MQLVALFNHRFSIRSENAFAAQKAGNDDSARNQVRNVFQCGAVKILVVNHQAARFNLFAVGGDFGGIFVGGLGRVLPKDDSHKNHDQDDTDNAERICNSVPDTREGCVHPGRGKG